MIPSVCEHTNFGAHECYGKKTKTLGSFCHILDVFSCTSCYVRDEEMELDKMGIEKVMAVCEHSALLTVYSPHVLLCSRVLLVPKAIKEKE